MAYRLTCPNCKHEFSYDNGYVERNILRLGKEIQEINLQLAEYDCLPRDEQRRKTDWKLRAKYCLAQKSKDLADLKEIKKASGHQIKQYEFEIFKSIVREFVGESRFQKFITEMEEELKDYKTSSLMQHGYTRSKGKSGIVNVSKL